MIGLAGTSTRNLAFFALLSGLAACGGGTKDSGASGLANMPCASDEDCSAGSCDMEAEECVESTCDPEIEEIGPMPRDQVGDECCTEKPGCSGYDREGENINPLYVGDTLACENGQWVADPGYCEGECKADQTLLGCVWDSAQGDFVRPQCGCQ
jgi:hypothetical protein